MTNCTTMAESLAEAARDRAERVDPATARMVETRDQAAAGGRFDLADSTQRVIESIRASGPAPDSHLRCYGSEPTDRQLRARRERGVER